jgi:hypothetical protein
LRPRKCRIISPRNPAGLPEAHNGQDITPPRFGGPCGLSQSLQDSPAGSVSQQSTSACPKQHTIRSSDRPGTKSMSNSCTLPGRVTPARFTVAAKRSLEENRGWGKRGWAV